MCMINTVVNNNINKQLSNRYVYEYKLNLLDVYSHFDIIYEDVIILMDFTIAFGGCTLRH